MTNRPKTLLQLIFESLVSRTKHYYNARIGENAELGGLTAGLFPYNSRCFRRIRRVALRSNA